MTAAPHDDHGRPRGSRLLLCHCCAVGRLLDDRPSASSRLEAVLGHDLVRLLRSALAQRGRRGRAAC